jgi:hypothetical protein
VGAVRVKPLDIFIKVVAATSKKIAKNNQIQHIQNITFGTNEGKDPDPPAFQRCEAVPGDASPRQ